MQNEEVQTQKYVYGMEYFVQNCQLSFKLLTRN